MALQNQVEELLQEAFPGGVVTVTDFGGGDHLSAYVRAPRFEGESLINQHKLVYAPVQHLLATAASTRSRSRRRQAHDRDRRPDPRGAPQRDQRTG